MTPELIHSVWTLVEDFPVQARLKSNFDSFICQMLEALSDRGAITPEETDVVRGYLTDRMLLIQDF